MMNETPTDPDELRAEIAQTRDDLGETAAALAAKLDVKGRVADSAHRATDHVKAQVGRATDQVKAQVEKVTDKAGEILGHARDAVVPHRGAGDE